MNIHRQCYSNLPEKDAIGWCRPRLLVEITLLLVVGTIIGRADRHEGKNAKLFVAGFEGL